MGIRLKLTLKVKQKYYEIYLCKYVSAEGFAAGEGLYIQQARKIIEHGETAAMKDES